MSTSPVKYSIVIPVFNSSDSLIILMERLSKIFSEEVKKNFEVILVDDGSQKSETWQVIEKLVKTYPNVKAFQLTRNFGKNGALLCGLENVRGEFIITMDDDLQHRPEDIPAFIKVEDNDIVIGNFKDKQTSFFKELFSKMNSWFERFLLDKPAQIRSGPYRLIKREIVEGMLKIKTAYPSISAQMYYVSRNVVNVEVTHDKRTYDKTGFTFQKMVKAFSNMLINNSSFLLKVIAILGLMISIASFGMGGFYIYKKLTVGTRVPGWASLMVTLLFIGGMILFSIGVLGEYLIRIINGVERKPSFVVRKKIE